MALFNFKGLFINLFLIVLIASVSLAQSKGVGDLNSKSCAQVNIIQQDLHCSTPGKFPLKGNCTFYYECVRNEQDLEKPYELSLRKCERDANFNGLECIPIIGNETECPKLICSFVLGDFKNVPFVDNLEFTSEIIVQDQSEELSLNETVTSSRERIVNVSDEFIPTNDTINMSPNHTSTNNASEIDLVSEITVAEHQEEEPCNETVSSSQEIIMNVTDEFALTNSTLNTSWNYTSNNNTTQTDLSSEQSDAVVPEEIQEIADDEFAVNDEQTHHNDTNKEKSGSYRSPPTDDSHPETGKHEPVDPKDTSEKSFAFPILSETPPNDIDHHDDKVLNRADNNFVNNASIQVSFKFINMLYLLFLIFVGGLFYM